MSTRTRTRSRRSTRRSLLTVLAVVLALVWAFPVYWMLNSAFLDTVTLQRSTPTFLPFGGSLDNFRTVVEDPGFVRALGISLVVTLTTVVAAIVIAFLGALAISRFQAFMRITFPLLAPGLVASGVYAFLQAWNEFTVALVILQAQEYQTLPLWLRGFVQASATRATDWGQVMAASTLVAVPVIVFFLIVQGRLTSGLVAGAVKG